jgi:nicotinamidase-related amidase
MSLTALDAETALVVIDLQQGIVSLPTAHPIGDVVGRACALADAFRRHRLPVVLVNVTGVPSGRTEQSRFSGELPPGFAGFIPELNQQPSDHVVTKQTAGAFTKIDLETHLRSRGVTQIVLAGVATSIGVESTARQAHELGFNVALATDAMTDLDAEIHINSVGKVFPQLGETGTTTEILDILTMRGA